MGHTNKLILKRGFDINLEGKAKEEIDTTIKVTSFAIQPPNFIGISPIPKMLVEKGDKVKAGDQLFFDKKRPEILHVAPVSGEIKDVRRGEKRSIIEVIITPDKDIEFKKFDPVDIENSNRDVLIQFMLQSGLWTFIRQRPFDVIATPTDIPENIFISTFSTAPLAINNELVLRGQENAFQKGVDVLKKLTNGSVYLGLNGTSSTFNNVNGVEKVIFKGKHPAGNVGVQIHHIAPVNATKKAWVVNVQDVISIGTMFLEWKYDASRIVALTGQELESPKYVKTYIGANIGDLLKGNLKNDKARIISGNVLTGKKKESFGYLDFYDDQITVIEEGDEYEFFGWFIPGKRLPSASRTFFNFLSPNKKYKVNTNVHGEKRSFVMTGQFEKMLPMDIYPQHLFKAILVRDYEKMEGLGIYELVEEDVALCEFADTSKQPLQKILREGLDLLMYDE